MSEALSEYVPLVEYEALIKMLEILEVKHAEDMEKKQREAVAAKEEIEKLEKKFVELQKMLEKVEKEIENFAEDLNVNNNNNGPDKVIIEISDDDDDDVDGGNKRKSNGGHINSEFCFGL